MEIQKYLQAILAKHSIDEDSPEVTPLRGEKKKVEKVLRDNFNESTISIQYAGSYKKGTMIKDSYDLDIICYFNYDDSSPGDTLEDIYNNTKNALEEKYSVDTKKSALRIKSSEGTDFHIDVVPGRFTDNTKEDVFLYQSFGEKGMLKTNLNKHINHIKDSKLINTIKLIKIWKQINSLDIKTFILELLVIKVLDKKEDGDGLENCLIGFWEKLRDGINEISIEDPANPTGNDLTHLFNNNVKLSLSSTAKKTLDSIENENWENIFGTSEDVSKAYKISSIQAIKKDSDNPSKPWCDRI